MRRGYHRWTECDAELLRGGYARGTAVAALAARIGTTAAAIKTRARRLCLRHRRGTRSLTERFADYVSPEPNSGCWLWDGPIDQSGYGQLRISPRRFRYATHVALEADGRPVPAGGRARHRCGTRSCVNPAHLVPA